MIALPTLPDDLAQPWETQSLDALFDAHLDHVLGCCEAALVAAGREALIIDAGVPPMHFLDDQPTDYRCNPHFRWLCPLPEPSGSSLLVRLGQRPRLLQHLPQDFWHMPPAAAEGPWTPRFDVEAHVSADAIEGRLSALTADLRTDRIDPQAPVNASVTDASRCNPQTLLHALHYDRARKTAYEQACMAQASRRAAHGHQAAAAAFATGASEYEIHLAYLQATGHLDNELPYGSIVALGTHGAVLHYQHRQRQAPLVPAPSLLIDAGADFRGYAADVTRTHARPGSEFAALVDAMDDAQRRLVAAVQPGADFEQLHAMAHAEVAAVLLRTGLATGVSAEALVATGVTHALLPHGLGHLLGLQTHDIGGLQQDADGTQRPPPDSDAALRLTRTLEPGFVVTIEPGLYFIPMLLDELRDRGAHRPLDITRMAALSPAGGIRIEDNVVVTEDGQRNLTRDAFASLTP